MMSKYHKYLRYKTEFGTEFKYDLLLIINALDFFLKISEIVKVKVINFLVETENEEPVGVANDPADIGGC